MGIFVHKCYLNLCFVPSIMPGGRESVETSTDVASTHSVLIEKPKYRYLLQTLSWLSLCFCFLLFLFELMYTMFVVLQIEATLLQSPISVLLLIPECLSPTVQSSLSWRCNRSICATLKCIFNTFKKIS